MSIEMPRTKRSGVVRCQVCVCSVWRVKILSSTLNWKTATTAVRSVWLLFQEYDNTIFYVLRGSSVFKRNWFIFFIPSQPKTSRVLPWRQYCGTQQLPVQHDLLKCYQLLSLVIGLSRAFTQCNPWLDPWESTTFSDSCNFTVNLPLPESLYSFRRPMHR